MGRVQPNTTLESRDHDEEFFDRLLPGLVGHPRHGVEAGEAGHSAQPVVHLARVVLLTTLQ